MAPDLPTAPLQALNLHISTFKLLCRYGGETSLLARAAAAIVPAFRSIGGLDKEVDIDVALQGQRWSAWEAAEKSAANSTARQLRFSPTYRDGEHAGLVLLAQDGRWVPWQERGSRPALGEGFRALLVLSEPGKRRTLCRFREQPPGVVAYTPVAPLAGQGGDLQRILTGLLAAGVA